MSSKTDIPTVKYPYEDLLEKYNRLVKRIDELSEKSEMLMEHHVSTLSSLVCGGCTHLLVLGDKDDRGWWKVMKSSYAYSAAISLINLGEWELCEDGWSGDDMIFARPKIKT